MNILKEHIPEFIIKEIERLIKNKDHEERKIIIKYSYTGELLFSKNDLFRRDNDIIRFAELTHFTQIGRVLACERKIPKECMSKINELSKSLID